MNTYTIVPRPETLDWRYIPAAEICNFVATAPLPISAKVKLCYDEQALYVRLEAVEQDIRATLSGLLDEVCQDSCLEFFFRPDPEDLRYFNIECNPNGCLYMGFGSNVHNLIRLIPEEPFIHPQIERTADGWTTTYAVPYSFIRQFFPHFSPAPGKSILANCYKCGDNTPNPHYITWNPIPEEPLTFHCPQHFGTMYFG